MSLINEALKKAQKLRHEGAAAGGADPQGPIVKRAQPKSARSTLLIVIGAVVLVVLSISLTAVWLSRPSTPRVAATKSAATPAATASDAASAPVVIVPPIAPAPAASKSAETKTGEPKAATVATAPTAKPAARSGGEATRATDVASVSAPSAATATPSLASEPAAAPNVATASPAPTAASQLPVARAEPVPKAEPDERIHQYVEALKVTGIRSSGTESKVLMNDRVYRVNDIVDRGLGIRLTKVAPDSLTFTDANGVTYVKYF